MIWLLIYYEICFFWGKMKIKVIIILIWILLECYFCFRLVKKLYDGLCFKGCVCFNINEFVCGKNEKIYDNECEVICV